MTRKNKKPDHKHSKVELSAHGRFFNKIQLKCSIFEFLLVSRLDDDTYHLVLPSDNLSIITDSNTIEYYVWTKVLIVEEPNKN